MGKKISARMPSALCAMVPTMQCTLALRTPLSAKRASTRTDAEPTQSKSKPHNREATAGRRAPQATQPAHTQRDTNNHANHPRPQTATKQGAAQRDPHNKQHNNPENHTHQSERAHTQPADRPHRAQRATQTPQHNQPTQHGPRRIQQQCNHPQGGTRAQKRKPKRNHCWQQAMRQRSTRDLVPHDKLDDAISN